MVNAVVPSRKPSGFGWLQFEKKRPSGTPEARHTLARGNGHPPVPGQQHEPLKRPCGQPDGHRGRHRAKRESVNRALKYLREHNFIQSVKAGGATVYVVNSKVAGRGNRGERYAAFGADVLAIEAEQEQDLIDDPRPLKSVPKLIEGERLLVGNEPIDPPDQGELELP